MCPQSIGRPSFYFSAWGAGSGQASSRRSALCTCKQHAGSWIFCFCLTRYLPVAGSGSVCPVPPSTTQQPVRVCVRVLVHQLAVMSFAGTSPVPNVYPLHVTLHPVTFRHVTSRYQVQGSRYHLTSRHISSRHVPLPGSSFEVPARSRCGPTWPPPGQPRSAREGRVPAHVI